MTSWIKSTNQKKRIFKNLEEVNTIQIVSPPLPDPIYNICYIPYLFDYNEGRRLSNIIKEFCIMKLYNVYKHIISYYIVSNCI